MLMALSSLEGRALSMSAFVARGTSDGQSIGSPWVVYLGAALLLAIVGAVEALVIRRAFGPGRLCFDSLIANLGSVVVALTLTALVGSNISRLLAIWACAYVGATTCLAWRWCRLGWQRLLPLLAMANAVSMAIVFAVVYPFWNAVLRTDWPVAPADVVVKAIPKSEHWTTIWADRCSEFTDVEAVDSKHIWVARGDCPLLHTEDGGKTWIAHRISCEQVRFVNWRIGWATTVTYGDEPGQVGITRDGGDSWRWAPLRDGYPYDLAPISATEAWALSWTPNVIRDSAGPDCLIHTRDGGSSWTSVFPPRAVRLRGLFFLDRDHGWAVGDQPDATTGPLTILRTANAGRTFQAVTVPVSRTGSNAPWHIEFRTLREGWIAVGGESLLHTTDGGITWVTVTPTRYPGVCLVDCSFPTKKEGWAVGLTRAGGELNMPFVVHTEDAGGTWQTVSLAGSMCGGVSNVTFEDVSHGVLAAHLYVPGASDSSVNLVLRRDMVVKGEFRGHTT